MTAAELVARLEELGKSAGVPLELLIVADGFEDPRLVALHGNYVQLAPDHGYDEW